MENKFTNNEIIKALECCGKGFGNCEGCPYDDDYHDCVTNDGKTLIMQDCIDLINRQKAEIERLIGDLTAYKVRWAKAEASKETAKSEARKEFAELIKQSTTDRSIDELLEELEGEEVG